MTSDLCRYVSRLEFDGVYLDAFISDYQLNLNLITSLSLKHMFFNDNIINHLSTFPNLRVLILQHTGINLVSENMNANLRLTVFHYICGTFVIHHNNPSHLRNFRNFISHSSNTLEELVLHRNAHESWNYNEYFLNYIDLFNDITEFPNLTYLQMDFLHSASYSLINFLAKCPNLTNVILIVYGGTRAEIQSICLTVFSHPRVRRMELRYSPTLTDETIHFLNTFNPLPKIFSHTLTHCRLSQG